MIAIFALSWLSEIKATISPRYAYICFVKVASDQPLPYYFILVIPLLSNVLFIMRSLHSGWWECELFLTLRDFGICSRTAFWWFFPWPCGVSLRISTQPKILGDPSADVFPLFPFLWNFFLYIALFYKFLLPRPPWRLISVSSTQQNCQLFRFPLYA